MTLQQLGKEYKQEELRIRARLKELRQLAKQDDSELLRRRIYYLTVEATDCRKTANRLMHYYEKGRAQ